MLALVAAGQWLMKRTRFGSQVQLTGTAYQVARLSGVPVERIVMLTFLVSAFTTTMAGLLLTSTNRQGTFDTGVGYDFDAVTAVVLGGVSLNGGRGSVVGVLGGLLVIGVLVNLMTLIGLNSFAQMVVKGSVFVVVVGLTSWLGTQNRAGLMFSLSRRSLAEWRISLLPAAVFVVMALLAPRFLTVANLTGVAKGASLSALPAIGFTIVMICGKLDLSIGTSLTLGGNAGRRIAADAGLGRGNLCCDAGGGGPGLGQRVSRCQSQSGFVYCNARHDDRHAGPGLHLRSRRDAGRDRFSPRATGWKSRFCRC